MRNSHLISLIMLILGTVWFVWFRPMFLGGPASYIIVRGISMEPTMHTGDLVIVHRKDSYKPGDVAAFQVRGSKVIHRIIGGNAEDGYITLGDNKTAPDPYRPKPAQIYGKQWIHLPGAGTWLGDMKEPKRLGFVTGVLTVFAAGGTAATKRRRRYDGMIGFNKSPKSEGRGTPPPGAVPALWAVGGAAAGFALLAFVAFRADSDKPVFVKQAEYEHTATWEYKAQVQPSTLYPDGVVGPVKPPMTVQVNGRASSATQPAASAPKPAATPLYTKLLQGMDLTFAYRTTGEPAPETGGEVSAMAKVTAKEGNGDGWSKSIDLLPPTPFSASGLNVTIPLDTANLFKLIETVEAETGAKANAYEVQIIPSVQVKGSIGDRQITELWQSPFTMRLAGGTLTPDAELRRTESKPLGEMLPAAQDLSLLGLSIGVTPARWIGGAGALLFGLATAALGLFIYSRIRRSDEEKVKVLYGSLLVNVSDANLKDVNQRIHVASMQDLVKLAQKDGGVIFHQNGVPGVNRYFVHHGTVAYEYDAHAMSENGSAIGHKPGGTAVLDAETAASDTSDTARAED